jgi:hypothetical protein
VISAKVARACPSSITPKFPCETAPGGTLNVNSIVRATPKAEAVKFHFIVAGSKMPKKAI